MGEQHPGDMAVSRRDPEELRRRLAAWLEFQLPGRHASIERIESPSGNGMSSETLLVDAIWDVDGVSARHRLVVRLAPDVDDVPVFPSYDLEQQFRAIELVESRSSVPVPHLHWLELDADIVGGQFIVMDCVEGRVPPDVMPYTFEGWLLEADPADRRALQDASVDVLAAIHAVELSAEEAAYFEAKTPGDTPLRRHVNHWRAYYEWMREGVSYPLLERGFDWIDANWPADEGDTVLSWGDSRIGNMMFDGFAPVAVFDWEMVGIGPRGLDVGWMIFLHQFFEEITHEFGLPGLPDMMRSDDVADRYETTSGVAVDNLAFYEVWAALRHGVVMARVNARRVHFGEAEAPAEPDDAIMHRRRLAEMIASPPS